MLPTQPGTFSCQALLMGGGGCLMKKGCHVLLFLPEALTGAMAQKEHLPLRRPWQRQPASQWGGLRHVAGVLLMGKEPALSSATPTIWGVSWSFLFFFPQPSFIFCEANVLSVCSEWPLCHYTHAGRVGGGSAGCYYCCPLHR